MYIYKTVSECSFHGLLILLLYSYCYFMLISLSLCFVLKYIPFLFCVHDKFGFDDCRDKKRNFLHYIFKFFRELYRNSVYFSLAYCSLNKYVQKILQS